MIAIIPNIMPAPKRILKLVKAEFIAFPVVWIRFEDKFELVI